MLLSDPSRVDTTGWRRFANRGAALGLLSGAFFAVSAVGYRAASLSLPSGDVLMRAALTLAVVATAQTMILGAWLIWREPGEVARVLRSWRVTALVGVTMMFEMLCLFADSLAGK